MSLKPSYNKIEKRFKALEKEYDELKESLKAIQTSEELHRITIENISDTIIITDDHGKFVYICPNTHIIFGLSPSEIYKLETFQALLNGTVCDISKLKRKNELKNIEWSITDKSGDEHFLLINAKSVNIHDGTALYTIRDITERKREEDSQRKSELQFKLLTETLKDVFWMSTRGVGEMIYISPAYETIWERSIESLYQSPRSFLEAVHPEDLNEFLEILDNYHKNGMPYEHEYRIILKDRRVKWIHEKGYPVSVKLDGVQFMAGVCLDITNQKQLEQALKKSEEQYRMVVEDQTEVISRFNPDGTFTFVNETYCKFFGISESDLIEYEWSSVAHEDDLPDINRQLQDMSAENPIVVIDNRVRDAAGRIRFMQFVNRGFFNEKRQLSEIQSVGRDITELKEVEKLLLEKEKELQKKSNALENVNIALEVLLDQRNRQLKDLKENIYRNFNKLIVPDLNNLKKRLKIESNKKIISMIVNNFAQLLSSDTDELTSQKYNLTKAELKIVTMIRDDMTSKEIAELLCISPDTVAFHRKNIRKKLDISQSDSNLSDFIKHHL